MKRIRTIRDVDCCGKRTFLRVDFNVPLGRGGTVSDDTRIVAALPTIRWLTEKKAKVILASHLGRPGGKADPAYSLKPVAAALARRLGQPVIFVKDCIGPEVEEAVENMSAGSVLLLENLRFHPGEEKNDPRFSEQLGRLAEIYVNDAFGSAHRAHSSTKGIADFVGVRVGGFLMERELLYLGEKTAHPERPFVVLLGGAKVSDKIQVVEALLEKADTLLIGGAMAYTFLLARGFAVGESLVEREKLDRARATLEKAGEKGVKLLLPIDHRIVNRLDMEEGRIGEEGIAKGDIPEGWRGVDIGPETVERYRGEISSAKTVLWNGPMGIFEIESCARGTFAVAEAVASNPGLLSIIGGGDSVKAIKESGFSEKVSFISTGGGAGLEYLEGRELPGVSALEKQ